MKKLSLLLFLLLLTVCACSNESEENNTTTDLTNLNVGSTFTTANNVDITLDSVNLSNGNGVYIPTEGNVYLIFNWTISNTSEEAEPDNISFTTTVDSAPIEGLNLEGFTTPLNITGTIEPQTEQSGQTVYEIPASWTNISVNLTCDSDTATFNITPDQVS